MKLFISTWPINGPWVAGDSNWTNEGEILTFGFLCSTQACGCGRCMSGIDSLKATTTMLVADLDLCLEDLADRIYTSRESGGWRKSGYSPQDAKREAEELVLAAMPFEVGDYVRRDGIILRTAEKAHPLSRAEHFTRLEEQYEFLPRVGEGWEIDKETWTFCLVESAELGCRTVCDEDVFFVSEFPDIASKYIRRGDRFFHQYIARATARAQGCKIG